MDVTQNEYTTLGQVKATIPPDGYSAGGFYANAYQTNDYYYSNGQLYETSGPNVTDVYYYDNAGNQTTEVDLAGDTFTGYDSDDRTCWTLRDPVGSTPPAGASCTNPPSGSKSTTYWRDSSAPLVQTDERGNSTTYAYTNTMYPTSPTKVTDAMNNSPVFNVYDSLGNRCLTGPSTSSNPTTCPTLPSGVPAGDSWSSFSEENQLMETVDQIGAATTYQYNDARFPMQPTQVTANYQSVSYGYDKDGNEVSENAPAGSSTYISTGYDADGRRCWTISGSTVVTASCTSPPTGSSSYTYDGANNLIETIDSYGTPSAMVDTRSYDDASNVLSNYNYEGSNTQGTGYVYTPAGEVQCIEEITVASPSTNCSNPASASNTYVAYTYNSAGQMATTSDWLGNVIHYPTYNPQSQVLTVNYPTTTGETVTYGYEPTGQVDAINYTGPAVGTTSDSFTPNADEEVQSSTQIGGAN